MGKSMRLSPVSTGVALVGVALAGLGCATGLPRTTDAITVTGSGRVALKPDTVLVELGAEVRAANLTEAAAEAARRMTEVLARVKGLGVADRDITTVTYSVQPVVPPRRKEDEIPHIIGYQVANIVQLRIRNLDAAGRILDAAVAAGANTVRGLTFTVDQRAKPEAEARALAVRDATVKARQLAEAGGVKLGELLSVSEGVSRPPIGFPRTAGAFELSAPGPVQTGEVEISIVVETRFAIAR
jgi:uncharacterized protein YggE